MQTIAVIAANGRTGKVFVRQALAAGYMVRAGVRGTHSFDDHPNLTVVKCDATNDVQVATLLNGANAVASFIGHSKNSPPRLQSEAIAIITRVMKQTGLTRIVSLTGTGVRVEGDSIPLADRLTVWGIRLLDPNRVKDGIAHYEVLKRSGLEWTVLRVMKMQNVKPRGYTLKEHGPTKWYVSRVDVANAALEVLRDNTFIQKAPILS